MNLVFDIGNTTTKLAVFNGKEKKTISRHDEINRELLENLLSKYEIGKVIVSSVKNIPQSIIYYLNQNVQLVHILSHKSKLPFTIEYDTPDLLGTDRIAAVAGAYSVFPGDNVMIIDTGTAITFDFLSGTRYTGGNISPGIKMRFKALNLFTGKLPLAEQSDDFSFPGRNTNDAIIAGVIIGVTYEINEYIRTFKKELKDLKIIMTGGDSSFLTGRISFEHNYMPDIVIDGLNYILEYNAK
jgi:type III pantothenate kinase